MPGINGRFSMSDLRCPRFTSSIFCFSISGFFESHDKEEEKMRNIEYGIACARPAPTSPVIPMLFDKYLVCNDNYTYPLTTITLTHFF
jgi:hypothetical protein